jgi:hypothetical protein
VTKRKGKADVGASVRARLLNLAHLRNDEFQLVLSDFATERLLFRLGVSSHAGRFVLKGAMLFRLWSGNRHRATWDLDLLGKDAGTVREVTDVIRDLCSISCDDGIVFDPGSVSGEEITPEAEYHGVRVNLNAGLAGARIPMQIDVGFGDVVVPSQYHGG